jgi:hypothetical protein
MELSKVESLGHGITRIHAYDIGFADVAAVYSDRTEGWDVEVQQCNVANPRELAQMIEAFRRLEGLA